MAGSRTYRCARSARSPSPRASNTTPSTNWSGRSATRSERPAAGKLRRSACPAERRFTTTGFSRSSGSSRLTRWRSATSLRPRIPWSSRTCPRNNDAEPAVMPLEGAPVRCSMLASSSGTRTPDAMKKRGLLAPRSCPGVHARGVYVIYDDGGPLVEGYDGPQIVGMDLHRRRSVLVRMTEDGRKLGTVRIAKQPGAADSGDQAGGPAPPGGAGGLLRLVLGGG